MSTSDAAGARFRRLHKQLFDRLATIHQLHGAADGDVQDLMRVDAELGVEQKPPASRGRLPGKNHLLIEREWNENFR
jgi:hypothetical protein